MSHEETTLDVPDRAHPAPRISACAVCVDGPVRGVFELGAGETITIGRSRGSTIQIDDAAVSRLHATLTWDGKTRVRVVDHGSRNGTHVGTHRVVREAFAGHDDVVRAGPTSLVLLLPPADARLEARGGSMGTARTLAGRAARCELNVLVLGETGVGKEVLARAIHEASARQAGPFVALHCGAIPETLAESTLFGHERGSFTGADARREGVFEAGQGGTVFLDEIGELLESNQVRLLRVLEERTVTRVGGTRPIPIDVRVIAATHRDVDRAVIDGTFRRDLLYRIDVLRIRVPPLRERLDELPELARAILGDIAPDRVLDEGALTLLAHHPFPGNARELRNVLSRAAALSEDRTIDRNAIEDVFPQSATRGDGPLRGRVDDAERRAIEEALSATGGNQTHAAARLGISRRGLIYKMERHGLKRRS